MSTAQQTKDYTQKKNTINFNIHKQGIDSIRTYKVFPTTPACSKGT